MATIPTNLLAICVFVLCLHVGTISAEKSSLDDCYNGLGQAYAGIIPHSKDCSAFYHCQEKTPGSPEPVLGTCPPPLLFDFDGCVCHWPASANCYNPSNPDHVAAFFKCANLLP